MAFRKFGFILAHVKTIRNYYEKGKDSLGVFVECKV